MTKILLVPVIMGCALGGTVGIIKAIQHFFPEMDRLTRPFDQWNDPHEGHAEK